MLELLPFSFSPIWTPYTHIVVSLTAGWPPVGPWVIFSIHATWHSSGCLWLACEMLWKKGLWVAWRSAGLYLSSFSYGVLGGCSRTLCDYGPWWRAGLWVSFPGHTDWHSKVQVSICLPPFMQCCLDLIWFIFIHPRHKTALVTELGIKLGWTKDFHLLSPWLVSEYHHHQRVSLLIAMGERYFFLKSVATGRSTILQ